VKPQHKSDRSTDMATRGGGAKRPVSMIARPDLGAPFDRRRNRNPEPIRGGSRGWPEGPLHRYLVGNAPLSQSLRPAERPRFCNHAKLGDFRSQKRGSPLFVQSIKGRQKRISESLRLQKSVSTSRASIRLETPQ